MRRVIAITGAGRGIGLATARRFAAAGDQLALNYLHSGAALEGLDDALVLRGDVRDRDDAERFVGEAEERYGRIDVLITNAGILRSRASHEVPAEEWADTIATNLSGTWWCIRAALPGMVARRAGRIITVSSELGLIGFPTYAAYAASKGGIIALTKSLAKELAPLGILVNSVAPGPVVTDMLVHDTIEYNDETREQIPLRRFGEPHEIAATIEFLAGPGGDFMVGQVVSPNGGTAI
jgi:NAD(P)-dependent dehydrogenase (short-subunit alcohol dehydrogenase family)